MSEARFREDDDPPRHDLRSPSPDLLRGWTEAGSGLTAVLKDSEARIKLHPDTIFGTSNRFSDIRMHTQARQTYADPAEKNRIVQAASRILEATVDEKGATEHQRFDEALAALKMEEERIFVVVLLGATRDLVYWNWRYGYTLIGRPVARTDEETRENAARFASDTGRRRVAAPALARARYGRLVTDVSTTNER